MRVTRRSQLTGRTTTRDLPITDAQVQAYLKGGLVQEVFPHLTAGDREFLVTGITEQEWAEAFDHEPCYPSEGLVEALGLDPLLCGECDDYH